jgi:hypothetical protein
MTAPSACDWADVPFRKSTASDTTGGQCVEVGVRPGVIGVRDSKSPGAGMLELPAVAWAEFVTVITG